MMRVVAGLCLVLWGAMAYGQTVRWRPDEVVKCHLESGDPYSQVFVRIERVGSLSRAATVSYATSGGTATPGVDYEPVAGTFQFRASPSGFEDALVPFLVFDDALREPNETVELTLSVSGGATLEGPEAGGGDDHRRRVARGRDLRVL